MVKGFFENIGGGVINSYLDKPNTNIGLSYRGRAQFYRDKLVNNHNQEEIWADVPLALPAKTLGSFLGYTATGYNRDAFTNLPTKKPIKIRNLL